MAGCLLLLGNNTSADRAKARYYFTQGGLEAAGQNMPAAYEYFKKAYELDPTYMDAAFSYGSQRLFVRNDTLQTEPELIRSLKMMQGYVDSNPKDLYATQLYSYLTTALDTIEESIRVLEKTYGLMPAETHLLPVLSEAYMRRMKPDSAISTLERYEAIEGKSKDISLKKITYMLASGDTISAVGEVNALINNNPRDPFSHILKGNLYEVIGEMDSVITAYKSAEALAPENGAVKMSLAQYYRETGDSVMLDNMVYEALLMEDFELGDKLGILGDYLQKLLDESGDRSRGDHLFSVLQEQYPHEPEVLEMAARYAGAKGDFEGASEAIGYAIDMDPTNEMYWRMLVSFDLTESKYQKAAEDYERSTEHLDPSLQLRRLYSIAASMLEDTDRGEAIINQLLIDTDERLNPATATKETLDEVRRSLDYDGLDWVSSLYCIIGDLNYKAHKPEKSFEAFENSLYFLNDNALALNNYAYFLSEEGIELEKAKKMSRKVLDLVENNATYLDTYAWILYKMGEYHEALDYMELALELAGEQGDENEEYQIHYDAIKKAIENAESNKN